MKRNRCIECGGIYGHHFYGCPETPEETESEETEPEEEQVENTMVNEILESMKEERRALYSKQLLLEKMIRRIAAEAVKCEKISPELFICINDAIIEVNS